MTQKEAILEAIKHVGTAIDTFPDKDDSIRITNEVLYGIIATLKLIIEYRS